jgi:hypothetical protein
VNFFNKKYVKLLTLVIIAQPLLAVPPQEVYGESCQAYMIVYFITFLIGTILCGIIHEYSLYQPSSTHPHEDRDL